MQATRAYIGLGANLGDAVATLRAALHAMAALPNTRLAARSSFYRSKPLGGLAQNDYVNAVAALDTTLEATALLVALQDIERVHGRQRGPQRWAPRTLDLDILLYGQACIKNDVLTVPHPGIIEREFVLYPLYEIAGACELAGLGSLKALVQACPRRGLQRLDIPE